MKRFVALLLCPLLLLSFAPAAMAAAPRATCTPMQTVMTAEDVMFGSWFSLTNSGTQPFTLTGEATLEKQVDGIWQAQPRNPMVHTDTDQMLAPYANQNPLNPGETMRFAVELGLYTPSNDAQYGKYRLVLEAKSAEEASFTIAGAPYSIVREPTIPFDAGAVSLKPIQTTVHPDADRFYYQIVNDSERSLSYGADYRFERRVGDGWESVPVAGDIELAFPAIGIVQRPHTTSDEMLQLSLYEIIPGDYRLVKPLGAQGAAAFTRMISFTVADPKKSPAIDPADTLRIRLSDPQKGAHTLTLEESDPVSQEAIEQLRMMLRGMQTVAAPSGLGGTAPLQFTFTRAGKGAQTAAFYMRGETAYLRLAGRWYAAADPQLLTRITELLEGYGILLPESGEVLVSALEGLPALDGAAFSARSFTFPLTTKGWKATLGEKSSLSVLTLLSAPFAKEQAELIRDGGYTLRPISYDAKGAPRFANDVRFAPTALTPHYFLCREQLVIYTGDNPAILSALTKLLGTEVDTLH